jgi:hypothetical protein
LSELLPPIPDSDYSPEEVSRRAAIEEALRSIELTTDERNKGLATDQDVSEVTQGATNFVMALALMANMQRNIIDGLAKMGINYRKR